VHEKLTLLLEVYIPNGQPPPEMTRDFLFVMFKVYYNGELDKMAKEPLERKEEVIQTGLFDPKPDKKSDNPKGTKVDKG